MQIFDKFEYHLNGFELAIYSPQQILAIKIKLIVEHVIVQIVCSLHYVLPRARVLASFNIHKMRHVNRDANASALMQTSAVSVPLCILDTTISTVRRLKYHFDISSSNCPGFILFEKNLAICSFQIFDPVQIDETQSDATLTRVSFNCIALHRINCIIITQR